MSIQKQSIPVSGLTVHVYSQSDIDPATPVAILVFLHGRLGSVENVEWVAHSTLQGVQERRKDGAQPAQDLLIVTFDQRNHGSRLVTELANEDWAKKNDRHAIDMYAIYDGTSRDVSYLIDFLPAYLFPSGERQITQWLVGGISLGGHASWLTLRTEPRVKLGIPIIGCPDYLALMTDRAIKNGLTTGAPHFPDALLAVIKKDDPASAPYTSKEADNPFLGKKILVLSGADDKLVPWAASEKFVESLELGESGVKKVVLAPGVGHECTPDMVKEMTKFIWEEALAA
ncbi:alpha/beta-hydrolase [Obba rivulosa]|uniref:Alpha/beta-hydrolase n=1 Tax=Obba rivulosa TaxID=1052685 RepID=A0A8E2DS39_9APHY|nr:alpha/beta-hydrolase [Obba rivulosa]